MKWKLSMLPVIVAALLAPTIAGAQFKILSDVVGSGGGPAISGQFIVVGTIGQGVIGPTASAVLIDGQGFWYTLGRLGTSSVSEQYMTGGSAETMLWQNSPNPFSDWTSIRVSIPTNAYVSLKLYDKLGRLVKPLIDGERSAGTITVRLTADDLESGSYTAQLVANGARRSITMIVVK